MPVPAQLWVSIKFQEMPTLVRTNKHGWRTYSVDCGDGRIITFELRPRMFMKIETGASTYSRWTAVVSGRMGARHGNGFHINEADVVAVMENKKPPKEAKAETPVTSETPVVAVVGEAPSAAMHEGAPTIAATPAEELPAVSAEGEAPVPFAMPAAPMKTPKKAKRSKAPKERRGPEVYRVMRGGSAEGAAPEPELVAPERNDTEL